MLWSNPNKDNIDQNQIKTYGIKPGSILDVPKVITLSGKHFEESLKEHFRKQVEDTALIVSMFPIYDIYRKNGAVNVISHQSKFLKSRHERIVIDLIKENVEHLKQLERYLN